MNKPLRIVSGMAGCGLVAATLLGCGEPLPTKLVNAPPGPADLGPATGLSNPPPGAVVFDLSYVAQTGGKEDIQYHSFWGYGVEEEARTNSFLADVRQQAFRVRHVCNYALRGRKWAAVEHNGRQATAFFFDLNADGKFSDNERILPTRKVDRGVEFITPDFVQVQEDGEGASSFCRVLLQANFYGNNSEPNCMWSPAALLDGSAALNGKPARLLLFANHPAGVFDRFGSSSFSLLLEDAAKTATGQYLPREQLSSLISSGGQFLHLSVEGRRSNGLPARVVLTRDTTPTGELTVKLTGSNSLESALGSLYLNGVDDRAVFLRVEGKQGKMKLPAGTYGLDSGSLAYGTTNSREWDVSFSQAPQATIKGGAVTELALGQPVLTVRAVEEKNRYDRMASGAATFKRGARIYLEPRILGKGGELYGQFRQAVPGRDVSDKADRPPQVTITGSDGKQLHSSTMEYGTCGVSWGGPTIPAGRYTVQMTQETGPLAGRLIGRLELKIE
jgi:hypothetical protein